MGGFDEDILNEEFGLKAYEVQSLSHLAIEAKTILAPKISPT